MALLPQDPQQQKRLLIGLAPLLLVFVYYYFFHTKATAQIAEQQTRLEALEAANGPARIQAAQSGPELQQKLELYEQHMVTLEKLIPAREEVPDLLHSMTLRAEDTGVELATMKPESEEPGQFYTRQTYEMGVIGSYHRIGEFLAAIGSLPRIITPIDVSLASRNRQERQGGMQLEARFRIETYVIPPPGSAQPDSAAQATGAANAGA